MAGKGHEGNPLRFAASPEADADDDTVTIVLPRRAAEDLYYAIAMALGSRRVALFGDAAFGPAKKGKPSKGGA